MSTTPSSPALRPRRTGPAVLALYYVVLLLRVGLGLSILNSGLLEYLTNQMGIPRGGAMRGMPRMGISAPGLHDLPAVPVVEILIGVALMLGFFTTIAAGIAGLVLLVDPAIQTVSMISGGTPGSLPMMGFMMSMAFGTGLSGMLAASGVVLLSTSGINPLSIDALMFRPRGISATGEGSPDPATTA